MPHLCAALLRVTWNCALLGQMWFARELRNVEKNRDQQWDAHSPSTKARYALANFKLKQFSQRDLLVITLIASNHHCITCPST